MDLTSDTGMRLNPAAGSWSFYLRLAEAYGWRPLGTQPPEGVRPRRWKGGYDSNAGQRVTREDAAAMADALERVLGDPGAAAKQREIERQLDAEFRELLVREGLDFLDDDDAGELTLEEPDRALTGVVDVRALIAFLRSGGFRIE